MSASPLRPSTRSTGRPGGHRSRRGFAAAVVAGLTLLASSCVTGVSTSPTAQAGQLTTRTLTVSVSGTGAPYAVIDAPGLANGGAQGFSLDYNGSSAVIGVNGTLRFDGGAGAGPSLTLALAAGLGGLSGSATVTDPAAGLAATVTGTASSFAADDHGNVSGSISQGAVTVTFATSSPAAALGSAPAYESLLAAEADFCADAQQRLAGLDPLQVPLASIVNTHESPRTAFASSKTTLTPLTARTWTDTTDITSESGQLVTISNHINCKMRSADHLATTGVTTAATDAQCSVLNQRAIDLALAQLTPSQQAAVTVPTLAADIVNQTGVEWTTPLPASAEFDGTSLRAHALLVNWTDPAYALFPDTIRGVHYCSVWSPAYAYFRLTQTLP